MTQQHYLTEEGAQRLREELTELKGARRSELAQRLRVAIQQGDLSENADYHKAKEDQAFLEGRIQELEMVLSKATIIPSNATMDGIVGIGSKLLVREKGREPVTYMVVGAKEADPRNGKVSNESPIGRALLGHRAGDSVSFETPVGMATLEIVQVE